MWRVCTLSSGLPSRVGKPERLPGLVAELLQAKVDVIVTTSTLETLAAKKATSTIPIVMTLVPDPIQQGLVASQRDPEVSDRFDDHGPGTSEKLIELLREAVPSALRFGVLRTGANSPFPEIRRELQIAAQQTGITLSYIDGIKAPEDIDPTLSRERRRTGREASSPSRCIHIPVQDDAGAGGPHSIACRGSTGFETSLRREASCRTVSASAT